MLQVLPALDVGGVERTTLDVAAALVAAGARAIVASEGGRGVAELEASGGRHVTFPAATKNPLQMAANVFALGRLVQEYGVDLLHARSRAPAWSALAAARRANVPLVTTLAGVHSGPNAAKRFYNSSLIRGDLVIANSAFTAAHLRAQHGEPKGRLLVIPRGVDLRRFDPAAVAPVRRDTLRAAWGVSEGAKVVLLAARLTSWKGQSVLIDAAAALDRPDVALVFAGDAQGRDRYQEKLAAQAAALGLATRVRFVGHVVDMPAALSLADAAVVASTLPEAFGRSATEAQAMGAPVVATAHGAPAETVLAPPAVPPGERTGWLVAPGDPSGLARGLAEALALAPKAREAFGRRARAHVAARYSLAAMTDATLAGYVWAIEERPRR